MVGTLIIKVNPTSAVRILDQEKDVVLMLRRDSLYNRVGQIRPCGDQLHMKITDHLADDFLYFFKGLMRTIAGGKVCGLPGSTLVRTVGNQAVS